MKDIQLLKSLSVRVFTLLEAYCEQGPGLRASLDHCLDVLELERSLGQAIRLHQAPLRVTEFKTTCANIEFELREAEAILKQELYREAQEAELPLG